MKPHGTPGRYRYELRHGQVPCDPCTGAHTRATGYGRRDLPGTGQICHPRPAPGPDLTLYPVIDLLARLMLGDNWRLEHETRP